MRIKIKLWNFAPLKLAYFNKNQTKSLAFEIKCLKTIFVCIEWIHTMFALKCDGNEQFGSAQSSITVLNKYNHKFR